MNFRETSVTSCGPEHECRLPPNTVEFCVFFSLISPEVFCGIGDEVRNVRELQPNWRSRIGAVDAGSVQLQNEKHASVLSLE